MLRHAALSSFNNNQPLVNLSQQPRPFHGSWSYKTQHRIWTTLLHRLSQMFKANYCSRISVVQLPHLPGKTVHSTNVYHRAKYNIIIYDNFTQLVVVGFSDVAETVVGLSVQELLTCKLEDDSLSMQIINSKQPNNQFPFQIRKKHSGTITSGNFFYNLVVCTPMTQSPPYETKTNFGPSVLFFSNLQNTCFKNTNV